jgi:UDP-N-acetylmuramoylalanine--D-glutamate ligase
VRLTDAKKILVLGLGKSGRAAARILALDGHDVVVTDDEPSAVSAASASPELAGLGGRIRPVEAPAAERALSGCGALVMSPGVPLDHPLVEAAKRRGVLVTGEIEVAYSRCSSPIVAVTGTNGKSTVVNLVGGILEAAGKKAVVAGNIGTPFASVVEKGERYDAIVLELSSFQLDTIIDFKADVAALLNVTADHLDRYRDSFGLYAASKARILNRAGRDTTFVYNADDAECVRIAGGFEGPKVPFSSSKPLEEGVFCREGEIVRRIGGVVEPVAPRASFSPIGVHNLENALAAVSIVTPMAIGSEHIRFALERYEPLPHRMEVVRTVRGVVYINDSKATNVDATIKSLRSVDGNVVLILGGSDKSIDFRPLLDHVQRVRTAVLIGQTRGKIRAALAGRCDMRDAKTMEEAVQMAAAAASPGDTVLLAPACASFDMFTSYAHRGEVFRAAVRAL